MLPKPLRDTAFLLRQLPQIGPRQAGRLTVFLFRNEKLRQDLVERLKNLNAGVHICERCFCIAEKSPCGLCGDKTRDTAILAVVEEDTDVENLENTHSFSGSYFVLGGRFNPHRGAPEEQGLRVKELTKRITKESKNLREVILAMNPTAEGDMLALALMRILKPSGVSLTRLGRGLPVGGEIEYADEETLKSALKHRG